MKYQNDRKYRVANITDTSSFLLHMFESPEWSPPPTPRSSSPSFHIDKTISYGGVCCLVKVLQVLAAALCLYFLALLLHPFLAPDWHNLSENTSPSELNVLKLRHVDISELPNPPSDTLLDLKNFKIKINANSGLCSVKNLLFLIIIHSKVDHFHLRQTIRSTWGGLTDLGGDDQQPHWKSRVVFILGESSPSPYQMPPYSYARSNVNETVKREAEKYQDLVVGSFPDLYKNLRYKHILGLKWASEHCSNATFFIKADDDAFIDLIALRSFLQRTLGPLEYQPKHIIGGNVSPEGTKPMRTGKWAVTLEEYPWKQYPPFLGGLAYLMTPDVARNLFRVAHVKEIPQIWVDDVWVTGILRTSLRIHPLYLNVRYNYNPEDIWRWLQNANPRLPPPSNFVHLDPSRRDWKETVVGLWKHVILAYNITQGNSNLEHLLHRSDYLVEGFS